MPCRGKSCLHIDSIVIFNLRFESLGLIGRQRVNFAEEFTLFVHPDKDLRAQAVSKLVGAGMCEQANVNEGLTELWVNFLPHTVSSQYDLLAGPLQGFLRC